jgi:hypothetical protein
VGLARVVSCSWSGWWWRYGLRVVKGADGVAGGRLPDWISVGVLAGSVPRDVIDEAVAVRGKAAKRSDGK